MSQLRDRLREDFRDEAARYAYVEAHLNVSVASQIKKCRGAMSQQDLADRLGTKQSGISRLENASYSSWKVETLRRLARAFGLRLRISFEEFGTLIPEIENFAKGTLDRRRFEDDPVFKESFSEELRKKAATGLFTPSNEKAHEHVPTARTNMVKVLNDRPLSRTTYLVLFGQPGTTQEPPMVGIYDPEILTEPPSAEAVYLGPNPQAAGRSTPESRSLAPIRIDYYERHEPDSDKYTRGRKRVTATKQIGRGLRYG